MSKVVTDTLQMSLQCHVGLFQPQAIPHCINSLYTNYGPDLLEMLLEAFSRLWMKGNRNDKKYAYHKKTDRCG